MDNFSVDNIREITKIARAEIVEKEKELVKNCIQNVANDGYYNYTMAIECYETVLWLREKGFKVIDKGTGKFIDWSPESVEIWDQHPWA
jgi:hypothetical protein